jgi:hypothetical protein
MTYGPDFSQAPFVPTFQYFPEDLSQLMVILNSMYTSLANGINQRQIGSFNSFEQLNGQFFTNPNDYQNPRNGFRKCFNLGIINAGATSTVAHGLTGVTIFTGFSGGVVTNVPDFRPIPFVSATLITDQIQVYADGTNVYVVNGATAPQIDSGILILDFLKN